MSLSKRNSEFAFTNQFPSLNPIEMSYNRRNMTEVEAHSKNNIITSHFGYYQTKIKRES